jgi:hypothetical protein
MLSPNIIIAAFSAVPEPTSALLGCTACCCSANGNDRNQQTNESFHASIPLIFRPNISGAREGYPVTYRYTRFRACGG